MISVDVEDVDGLGELLAGMPKIHFESAKEVIRQSAFTIQREVTDRIRFGPLNSRTGQLARSIRTEVHGTTMRTLGGSVYTDKIYAPIHEQGGTIRAKRAYSGVPGGPYLNIPSDANKTDAGVQRMSSTGVFNAGGYLIPLANSPSARYALMLDNVPMFWLVKSVDIPARLGLQESTDDEIPTLLSNLSDLLQEEYE